jgi:colanic acid biosynthesis glycosyl transferase WcaI
MHIAILNQDFPPETGAGPARITELAREWIAAGHRVSVITGFPNRKLPGQRDGIIPEAYRGRLYMREQWDGIEVHRSWLYASPKRAFAHTLVNYLTFAASSLLTSLAVLPRPDVLIASGPPYFQQFSGALAALARNIPLVLEIRDLWPDYVAEMGIIRDRRLLDVMFATERWLLDRADATVVVTESFKRRLVEKGVPPGSVTVIPNGVDTARYYPASAPNPLGDLAGAGPLVGYLGTFGAGQGLIAVVEAARLLHAQGTPIRFCLVGDGADRAMLEEDLRTRPVPGVTIHSPIPRDATHALYNACDVILVPHANLPVLGDTVPSKIFEVMACARPLVAALRGEGARIVERSGGGVLAQPGNPASIAAAVQRILGMTAEARLQMGAAGREFALREYDRRGLAERYLRLLERVTR